MQVWSKFSAVVVASGMVFLTFASSDDSLFTPPDILKQNVAFWKKIYSEIPLSDGVIHDAGYPLVIFKKLAGDPSPAAIRKEKETITLSLKALEEQPESTWTESQRRITELYTAAGDSGAWTGAAERVRFQRGQKDRFIAGLKRSGLFLDTIKAVFRSYGIPERLAYLPHVESSFNTAAYSKVGAAGLWQFMRGTGAIFGMKINYTIDERRDPVRATVAAAQYLSKAYAALGSWPLAITSYNYGLEGMRRAEEQTGSKDITVILRRYSGPSFQFASRNFYSCFLAASELAENRQQAFPGIEPLRPLRHRDLRLENFVAPAVLCRYLRVTPEQLVLLNPAVRPVIFTHNKQLPKGLLLHVPAEKPLTAENVALAAIPDSLKSLEGEEPRYYPVKEGDTLAGIAAALRTTTQALAQENELAPSARLHAGQILRIPSKAAPSLAAAPAPFVSPDTAASPLPPPVALQAPEPPAITPPKKTPQVEPGLGLRLLTLEKRLVASFQKKITPEPVAATTQSPAAEKNAPDSLTAKLAAAALAESDVPASARPEDSAAFDAALYNLDAAVAPDGKTAEIRAAVDETMSHYGEWLGVPGQRIRQLNRLDRNASIRIGQRLRIPLTRAGALEEFNTARLEYHMAIEEDFDSQFKVAEVRTRIVKKGENLWNLCGEGDNQIPQWLFKRYNTREDLSSLMPGDTVRLPIVEERTAAAPEHVAAPPLRDAPPVAAPRALLKWPPW